MANILGTRLRKLRIDVGLTQAQLAGETKLSVSSIKSYENGWREPNSKAMVALERFFNVSGEYLRGESDVRNQERTVADSDSRELLLEGLPDKLKRLGELLEDGSDAEVETAYHIVHELLHILTMEEPSQRSVSMSMFQDIVVAGIFFLDICETTSRDTDAADRIEYARGVALAQVEKALEKSQFFLQD